jgi:opacity protein-like surface antigen
MFFSIPIFCSAQDWTGSLYLQFETGISSALGPDVVFPDLVDADLGNTMYLGVGVGYQMFPQLRGDMTVTYRGGFEQSLAVGNNIRGRADFQSTSVLFNVNYEFAPWNGLTPHVGGGIGYVYNHLDQVSITTDDGTPLANINGAGDADFAFQLGGGITFPLKDKLQLDVGYRYFDGGTYGSDSVIHLAQGVNREFSRTEGDLSAHELNVGLRILIH